MKNENPLDNGEMISQPLLTEDGFLNPACMNELADTIRNIPKTHDRLRGDPEWDSKEDKWIFKKDIVGHFAMMSCKLSPYGVPDGLENVCKYLNVALNSCGTWNEFEMQEASLCEINKWLHEILYEQGVEEFDKWNECKVGSTPDIQFVSSMDGKTDPDRDFISLDALLHQTCVSIRDERRKNKAFDEKLEKMLKELPPRD